MRAKNYSFFFQRMSCYLLRGSSFKHPQSTWTISQRTFSDWNIVGALCLERKPIISCALTSLEQRYYNYLQKIEEEQSLLSDHEKRHLEDIRVAEKAKRGEIEDMDTISKQTAQDFEDASVEELNKFKRNPRTTEADATNNKKSLLRQLDSSLVLTVNHKLGNDFRWILPQAVHEEGETLRQTAERALKELSNSPIKVQIMGNAPIGYYKYKYPKAARGNGVCGAKVFFFKAQVLDKRVEFLDFKKTDVVSDHMWLTHKELAGILQPVYAKVVQSFLCPDTFETLDDPQTHQVSEDDESSIESSVSN